MSEAIKSARMEAQQKGLDLLRLLKGWVPSEPTDPDEGCRLQPNTDDAPVEVVLAVVLNCALCWKPEARIIGNVRAGDIVRALMAVRQVSNG